MAQRELKLHSPAGSEYPDVYQWTEDREAGQIDVGKELVETIRLVDQEFPGVMVGSDFSNYDTNSFDSMNNLVDKYNNLIDAYLQRIKNPTNPNERLGRMQSSSSRKLLRHILQQVYKHAVADPEKLNHYAAFSPAVYGEAYFELVCDIIDRLNVTEDDIFIDLGSGVGQIVLQVAASTPCKMVWGIEKADWPSFFAEQMDSHFKRLMCWWGKPYREYQLIKGDFLDQCHREKLNSASVIFANNYVFGPKLDQQLKERFTELRDGARIVSSKAFCPLNFNINGRNLTDIGSIMDVIQLKTKPDSVSWTDKPVPFFLHTINRAKLELYFNPPKVIKAPPKAKKYTNKSRTSRTKKVVDQVLPSDSLSNMVVRYSSELGGPRTRRARQKEATKSGKSDAIATVVACTSAGQPVGRVGRRRRNPAINKKSIPDVASSLPCNISDVIVSLPRLPEQQVAMVRERQRNHLDVRVVLHPLSAEILKVHVEKRRFSTKKTCTSTPCVNQVLLGFDLEGVNKYNTRVV